MGLVILKKAIIPNDYTSEFEGSQMHALLKYCSHNNLERH